MKIVKSFEDLEKANAYITDLNQAFEKEASEKSASEKKAKEITEALNREKTEHEGTKAALSESLAEVASLGETLSLHEKHGKDGLIVSVSGKSYTLVGNKFVYGGNEHTAEDLAKDENQLALMVKRKSSCLVPIN